MGDCVVETPKENIMKEKYRGPPPRKDLIPSPNKERDWKGNNWFSSMSTENMNGTNGTNGTNGNGTPDLGIAPGLSGEYTDPHLKAHRDYESDYAKLALQGGHKGLLSMNNGGDKSEKIPTLDDFGRRQKGCENISAYSKLALEGGHKDLLKIENNGKANSQNGQNGSPARKPKDRNTSSRACGDWYANNNNTPSPKQISKPTSPEPRTTTPIRDQRKSTNGNCIVPGGEQEPPRFGKKRFTNMNQRQEAPFATNY